MQVSAKYQDELRAIYRARVAESFSRARRCLLRARIARQGGDRIGRRKWLRAAKVFWLSGAGWRLRAQSLVLLLACLVPLAGCAKRDDMLLTIIDRPDGTIEWQIRMSGESWQRLQPARLNARTYELGQQTSITLVSAIDTALERRHSCARRWTFGQGFKLKDGTLVFTGQCNGKFVKS